MIGLRSNRKGGKEGNGLVGAIWRDLSMLREEFMGKRPYSGSAKKGKGINNQTARISKIKPELTEV